MLREKSFYSREAEMAVLGSIILDAQNILNDIIPKLKEEHFYFAENKKIYATIVKMYNNAEKVGMVTLKNRLKRENILNEVGGDEYLQKLVEQLDLLPHIDEYIKIVEEYYVLRHLLKTAKMISDNCASDLEVDTIIEQAENEIFKVREGRYKSDIVPISEKIGEVEKMITGYISRKEPVTGLPTGFSDLDKMTTGFQKGDFIVIAARPGVGKTSFALNILMNQCVKPNPEEDKRKGLIFSLEMTSEQLIQRMLCSYANITGTALRQGILKKEDIYNLSVAYKHFAQSEIYIDDSTKGTPLDIRAKSRRMALDKKIDFIIIDYIQMMHLDKKVENKQVEISEISRSLKLLAKELHIPVIALAQLSRSTEKRKEKPILSDIRDSGSIEQDADVVIFIHRKFEPGTTLDKATLIVAKQRNGPTGEIEMLFDSARTLFKQKA